MLYTEKMVKFVLEETNKAKDGVILSQNSLIENLRSEILRERRRADLLVDRLLGERGGIPSVMPEVILPNMEAEKEKKQIKVSFESIGNDLERETNNEE